MSESLLPQIARVAASAPALDDGTSQYGFGELVQAVRAELRWLAGAGVERCALLADNSAAWVVSDLALLEQRAVSIPLPGYFTLEQQRHVLQDAGAVHVLTDRHADFQRAHPQFSLIDVSSRTGLALLHREAPDVPSVAPGTAKVTYTSGSTGAPKGVCLSHAALAAVTRSLAQVTSGLGIRRHMCLLPLATLLENIAGIHVPLLLGAQTVVMPAASVGMSYGRMDVPRLLHAVQTARPESLVLVPELLRLFVMAARQGWKPPATLKFIAVGGATVAVELLQQARELGLPVFEGYGLSECASVVCLNTPEANRPGSVGRPLPHARVRIDDTGQICVRGATMSGYLGDASQGLEEVATGDLGDIDADGFVYVRGRLRNMFITSMGRNVTPEWVERELTCDPVIAQAMVVGEARPFAAALLSPSAAVADEVIDAAVARANLRLPEYARVARWARFPETPTFAAGLATANGRLRRDNIAQRFAGCIESLYATRDASNHVLS